MIVFLWLGNVVVAQACLSIAPVPAWTPHVYTCQYPETVPAVCNWLWQSCLWASNLQWCWGWTQCCICNYTPPVTESEPELVDPTCSCTNWVVSSCPITDLWQWIPWSNCTCSYGNDVLTCVDSATSTVPEWKCSKEWEVLKNKDNSKNTTFWCDCVEWFKQVGSECKSCTLEDVCCGVELNTKVPFIGDCIEDEKYTNDPTSVSQEEAFPVLMSSLTQMLVTIILIVSFVLIIIWGIQIATGNPSGGKKMIIKVVVAIAILWASGVILRLINPNFFG